VDPFQLHFFNIQIKRLSSRPGATFLKARHENKVQVKVTGSRRLENGLVIPGSFLARTTSSAIATKFEEEIIRLRELCTHMDITFEKLRRRPLFL